MRVDGESPAASYKEQIPSSARCLDTHEKAKAHGAVEGADGGVAGTRASSSWGYGPPAGAQTRLGHVGLLVLP